VERSTKRLPPFGLRRRVAGGVRTARHQGALPDLRSRPRYSLVRHGRSLGQRVGEVAARPAGRRDRARDHLQRRRHRRSLSGRIAPQRPREGI
ncbi:MAG: hypothetical protein AVDCRST_MAG67-1755, partial [uncultured Solirubrobacteraceae bacterium]